MHMHPYSCIATSELRVDLHNNVSLAIWVPRRGGYLFGKVQDIYLRPLQLIELSNISLPTTASLISRVPLHAGLQDVCGCRDGS